MKGNFGRRFSRDRVIRFFDKEGFYIVLFLCVCIVAITAIWVAKTDTGKDNTKKLNLGVDKGSESQLNTPDKEASIGDEESEIPVENNNIVKPKPDNKKDPKDEKKPDDKKREEKPAPKENPKKNTDGNSSFNIQSPIKDGLKAGNILKDHSPDDLLCFEAMNEWRIHTGIDIIATEGTEVVAASGGKVVDVRNDNDFLGGLGQTVVIDHGNGYRTQYSNLEENTQVNKDDIVKKGQIVGTVGKTSVYEKDRSQVENPTSHLHFELFSKEAGTYVSVDPKKYIQVQK